MESFYLTFIYNQVSFKHGRLFKLLNTRVTLRGTSLYADTYDFKAQKFSTMCCHVLVKLLSNINVCVYALVCKNDSDKNISNDNFSSNCSKNKRQQLI